MVNVTIYIKKKVFANLLTVNINSLSKSEPAAYRPFRLYSNSLKGLLILLVNHTETAHV